MTYNVLVQQWKWLHAHQHFNPSAKPVPVHNILQLVIITFTAARGVSKVALEAGFQHPNCDPPPTDG